MVYGGGHGPETLWRWWDSAWAETDSGVTGDLSPDSGMGTVEIERRIPILPFPYSNSIIITPMPYNHNIGLQLQFQLSTKSIAGVTKTNRHHEWA